MTFIEGKSVAEAFEELKFAYESGVNFFDNSESYGETTAGWERGGVSEEIMGEAVKIGIEKGTWARMDLVISTKLMWGGRGTMDTVNSIGLSRKHLVEGMHASLERMQLDYVDLVFCHRCFTSRHAHFAAPARLSAQRVPAADPTTARRSGRRCAR